MVVTNYHPLSQKRDFMLQSLDSTRLVDCVYRLLASATLLYSTFFIIIVLIAFFFCLLFMNYLEKFLTSTNPSKKRNILFLIFCSVLLNERIYFFPPNLLFCTAMFLFWSCRLEVEVVADQD